MGLTGFLCNYPLALYIEMLYSYIDVFVSGRVNSFRNVIKSENIIHHISEVYFRSSAKVFCEES